MTVVIDLTGRESLLDYKEIVDDLVESCRIEGMHEAGRKLDEANIEFDRKIRQLEETYDYGENKTSHI